jgi:hypothetical protein
MPYSGNFTRVTFVHDDPDTGGDALVVEGKSLQQPEDVKEIHVALPHGGDLLTASVPNPTSATDWSVTFPYAPFAVGEPVFVVGVALMSTADPPFVWHDTLRTTSRTDPP